MADWQPIESAPEPGEREMFVVVGVTAGNGFTGGREYRTDPWCVWREADGRFARWPHNWGPTHWLDLGEIPEPPTTKGEGE